MNKKILGVIASGLIKNCFPPWLVWIFAKQFIAGKNNTAALVAAKNLNECGFMVSLDYIGEEVTDCTQIKEVKKEYELILDRIEKDEINGDISLKLSHFGMFKEDIQSLVVNQKWLEDVIKKARQRKIVVWIDAERLKWRKDTWEIFKKYFPGYDNIGICIQAYAPDASEFLREKIKKGWKGPVRICKGAYRESDYKLLTGISLYNNFLSLCEIVIENGSYLQIATHDQILIEKAKTLASGASYEYAMLLGVNAEYAKKLARYGERVKIYLPYGNNFKDYVVRRIMEKPGYIFLPFKNF